MNRRLNLARAVWLMSVLAAACDDEKGPTQLGALSFAALSAGEYYSCGLTTGGAAYCWGDNYFGQLGIRVEYGGTAAVPVRVAGGPTFAALSAGRGHSCGLTTGGAAYCWGNNSSGQLGIEMTANSSYSSVPVRVAGGLSFAALSAGEYYSCGLTTGGAAYCWGRNSEGQLGTGTRIESSVPVLVSGGLTFAALSAAGGHSCGLTTGGAAYCWGNNSSGELGVGTTTGPQQCTVYACSLVPVPVAGGLSFVALSAGGSYSYSCGLTTGGAAYCWGRNSEGQLGTGTRIESSVPVLVSGGLTFAALNAGRVHNCGLTTGGAAYCWGNNSDGQLGIEMTADSSYSSVPVLVAGGLTFAALSLGFAHSCGLTTGGAAYCWGNNYFGQLGIGSHTYSSVPVPVSGG